MEDLNKVSSEQISVRRADDPHYTVDNVKQRDFEARLCLEVNDSSDEHVGYFSGKVTVFLSEDGEVVDDRLVGPVLEQKQHLLELHSDDLTSGHRASEGRIEE